MRRLTTAETFSSAVQAAAALAGARRADRLPGERAEEKTLARLRRLVDHAFATVPMYRDLYGSVGYAKGSLRTLADFRHLPVVTKEHFLGEPAARVVSSTVPGGRRLASITSGTSGEVLTVWHDAGRLGRLGLAVLRVTTRVAPHRPWHRLMYVYTAPFPIGSAFGLFPMSFVPTTAPVTDIAATWRRLAPDVVWIYPSRLRDLLDAGADLPPCRLVSVGSEMSSARERTAWEERLGSPVRDQYGTEELGLVAAECLHRRRHVFSDLCHVEILRGDGTPAPPGHAGEIVGTNLDNMAMPFIRYRQGDRGSLQAPSCPCGRRSDVLDPLEGRSRMAFTTPGGERVGSGVLVDALYGLILDLGLDLDGYRLVDPSRPTLLLAGTVSDDDARAAVAHVRRTTGLDVIARVVARLPPPRGDKREIVAGEPSQPDGREVDGVDDRPSQAVDRQDGAEPAADQTGEQ